MTDVAQNALNKPLKKQHTYDRKATDHELYFQYEWPVRVTKRRISETDEVILNVSPPFSTSFNGVQFTWALRLSDECIETGNPEEPSSTVNIYLYYKEGPIQVVHLLSASVTVMDSSGGVMFSELPIKETEWTRGSGWPVDSEGKQMQCLTKYVHENVNGIIKAVANIRMEPGAFYPLLYLPTLSDKNRQLAEACKDYLRHAAALNSIVPGTTLSLRDVKPKMYSMHKLILTNACLEIDRRLLSVYDPEQLRNLFAHIYFNERIVPHVTRLEDYIELIEGYHASDALTLVREAERFICSRMNMGTTDLSVVKKMLLLAERYKMKVLKMMCSGIIADHMIACSEENKEMNEFSSEMHVLAMRTSSGGSPHGDHMDESLAENVVDQVKQLSQRIRRVSLSRT